MPSSKSASPNTEPVATTPTAKGASLYHRFIPREEVQVVSAWTFNAMDPQAEQSPAETPAAVPAEELEALRQRIYAEGFEHGRQAGAEESRLALEAPLKKAAQEQAQRLAQALAQAQAGLAQLEDRLAADLLELACEVARQVVRCELSQPLPSLQATVREALALTVEDGQAATVRLHPQDLALVRDALAQDQALEGLRLKWLADPALTPGGCRVDSVASAVDATVERRWVRAVANLGLAMPWTEDRSDSSPQDSGHV